MSGVRRAAAIESAAIARCTTRKVGAPVAERQHEAEPHRETEHLDAHRVGARVAKASPRVRQRRRQVALKPAPAAHVSQPQIHQRQKAGDDQKKLQHLVVDGAREPAEQDVREHDERRHRDARVEDVAGIQAERLKRAVKDVKELQQLRHRVHRNAGREHGHQRERHRVERARLLVEPQPQVLRHRPRARAVVERHHENPEEHHRGNRADPVEVARRDPVLRARRRHPDNLLRAEVRREERQPADPRGQGAAGLKKVGARLRGAPEREADAEHEREVDEKQRPVERGERHRAALIMR